MEKINLQNRLKPWYKATEREQLYKEEVMAKNIQGCKFDANISMIFMKGVVVVGTNLHYKTPFNEVVIRNWILILLYVKLQRKHLKQPTSSQP